MEINRTFGSVDIAISGMKAQSKHMEILSSNIANARTTDAGEGEPYRRLQPTFKASGEGISGVEMGDIEKDQSEFQKVFDPANPSADDQGYVSMPNVQVPVELMNLNIATRTYQANAAVLKRYQNMVETTLELLK